MIVSFIYNEQERELNMKLFNTEYQGEGWYEFRLWNDETDDWEWAETLPAVWVENEYDFVQRAPLASNDPANKFDFAVYYYGDGEIPNEPVEIADWCFETLTPKAQAAYKEMMGW